MRLVDPRRVGLLVGLCRSRPRADSAYRRARVAKPSRREALGLALAAAAAFAAGSSRARAAGDFSQWVAAFRAKALGRGISGDTYDRVMGGLRPDTTGLEAIRNQPEFNEQLWQYLNRRVVRLAHHRRQGEGEGVCAAVLPHRKGLRRRALGHARRLGRRVGLRRSGRAAASYATGHPVAGDTRLGRAAPPRLLEMELINALRSSSVVGAPRRKWLARGPVRWATPRGCPRCGCISASTTTMTARSRRSARRTMRSHPRRAISSSAASTGGASS
jgi:hypothetical protein